MHLYRVCLLALITATVVGCKLRITVPEGGDVATESGAYSCAEGEVCTIDVVDVFFDEKFMAVPKSCYEFKSWAQYESAFSFCGNSTTSCPLNTKLFGAFEALMAVLESDQMFFLQPEFEADMECLGEVVDGNFAGQDSFRHELRSFFNACIIDGYFSNSFKLVANGGAGELRIDYQTGGSVVLGDCSPVPGQVDTEIFPVAIDEETGIFSVEFRAASAITSITGQLQDDVVYLDYQIEFLEPNIIAPPVRRQVVLTGVGDG